jgi:hypothetical protein
MSSTMPVRRTGDCNNSRIGAGLDEHAATGFVGSLEFGETRHGS